MAAAPSPSLLDAQSRLLDEIVGVLHKVGIEVGPLFLQAVLLILLIGSLVAYRKRLWPPRKLRPPWLLSGLAAVVVVFAILLDWGRQLVFPLPGNLAGVVHAENKDDITIRLVDFQGARVSAGSGAIDSESGAFVLRYHASLGAEPRALIAAKSGCREQRRPLGRSELAAGSTVEIDFECEAP